MRRCQSLCGGGDYRQSAPRPTLREPQIPRGRFACRPRSRFNGACPNSPAADRQTPARNAGTSIGGTFARARSKSAPAFPSMKIHGAGLAASADFQAWRDERDWTAEICDVGNRRKDAVAETRLRVSSIGAPRNLFFTTRNHTPILGLRIMARVPKSRRRSQPRRWLFFWAGLIGRSWRACAANQPIRLLKNIGIRRLFSRKETDHNERCAKH